MCDLGILEVVKEQKFKVIHSYLESCVRNKQITRTLLFHNSEIKIFISCKTSFLLSILK